MRAVNAAVMRRLNRQLILNQIRKGPVSRMELAEATGLTRASVAQIVDELIREGIVAEAARMNREQAGRRGAQLTIAGAAGVIFGVNLSAERCDVGAINLRGDTLCQSAELVTGRTEEETLGSIVRTVRRQRAELGDALGPPPLVGVCAPNEGPGGDDSERMVGRLAAALEMDVCMERTANALALEHLYFSRLPSSFALLDVAQTLAAGVVVDGRLIRGARRTALSVGRACAREGRTLDEWAAVPALLRGTPYRSWAEWMDCAERPEDGALWDRLSARLAPVAIGLLNVFGLDCLALSGVACAPLVDRLNRAAEGRTALAARVVPALPENPVRVGAMAAYHAFFEMKLDET